jgi:hypothetical protein
MFQTTEETEKPLIEITPETIVNSFLQAIHDWPVDETVKLFAEDFIFSDSA